MIIIKEMYGDESWVWRICTWILWRTGWTQVMSCHRNQPWIIVNRPSNNSAQSCEPFPQRNGTIQFFSQSTKREPWERGCGSIWRTEARIPGNNNNLWVFNPFNLWIKKGRLFLKMWKRKVVGCHLFPSAKRTFPVSGSHKTFHFSYMKFLCLWKFLFIKV